MPYKEKIHVAVYSVALLTGLPFNLLALAAFLHKARRSQVGPNLVFLINLTISDLAFLLFLPFKILEAAAGSRWVLPPFLCPLSGLFYFSAIYSSSLFLTAVAVERYLGVAYPLRYKMCRRPARAIVVSLLLWVCAFSHCSIVYVTEYRRGAANASDNGSGPHGNGSGSGEPHTVCYDAFSEDQLDVLLPVRLELGIVLFCLPLLVTTFCYASFVHILLSSPHISRSKKVRAVGLVLTTLLVFLLCFGPYNVSHFVGYVEKRSPRWRGDALLFSTFNTSLDPVIFYFSSTAVKRACRRALAALCPLLGRPRPQPSTPAQSVGPSHSHNSPLRAGGGAERGGGERGTG